MNEKTFFSREEMEDFKQNFEEGKVDSIEVVIGQKTIRYEIVEVLVHTGIVLAAAGDKYIELRLKADCKIN